MPKFTLSGIQASSTVSLTASQGAASDSGSVANWGGATGTVSIDAQLPASGALAPQGVWFEAKDLSGLQLSNGDGIVYEPGLHEVTYLWTFGDPGIHTVPESMPTAWRDRNIAYGPRVSHTFKTAGQYTVTLWVVDRNGVSATAETTITIGNPDDAFPGNRTICFSKDGDFSEAPADCQQVTTVAQLHDAIFNLPQTTGVANAYRLLFRRSETVEDVTIPINGADVNGTRRFSNIAYIGAFGSGTRPILITEGISPIIKLGRLEVVTERFYLTDLDLRGRWDPATETGEAGFVSIDLMTHTFPGMIYSITDVEISGFSYTETTPGFGGVNDPQDGTIIWDSVKITNWRFFGLFARNMPPDIRTRVAFTGCCIAQNVDALSGGPKNGLHNEHGCMRTEAISDLFISGCDFFSRGGWSGLAGGLADQPCLRANSSGRSGAYINMERFVAEGGYEILQLKENAAGSPDSPINAIVDRAILIGTTKTLVHVSCDAGGTSLRNLYCYQPNVKAFHPNRMDNALWFTLGSGPTPDNIDNPIAVHGVTAVNMRTTANSAPNSENWSAQSGIDAFNIYTVENEIAHAPNLDVPITPYAPLDLSEPIPGVFTRYKGVRHNFAGEVVNLPSAVSPGGSVVIPYTDITEVLADGSGSATATDQDYWLDALAVDTGHFLLSGGFRYASRGDFTVVAETSGIRLTNTGTTDWPAGNMTLRLDRMSKLPPLDPAGDSSGQTVPIPRPVAGSAAIGTEAQGWATEKDLLLQVRQDPPARGAFRQD